MKALEQLEADYEGLTLRLRALERRFDQARAVLEEIQWNGQDGSCPVCMSYDGHGHMIDCKIQTLIQDSS